MQWSAWRWAWVALAVFAVVVGGCVAEDGASAEEIARGWTEEASGAIADAIAEEALSEVPALQGLASQAIRGQINGAIDWTFQEPEGLEEGRFRMTATASVPIDFDIPLFSAHYDISTDFRLEIDTGDGAVDVWSLDLGSFRITER